MPLHGAHHRRRSAHEDFAARRDTAGGHVAFDHIARDEALAAGPAGGRVVENVLRKSVSEVTGDRQAWDSRRLGSGRWIALAGRRAPCAGLGPVSARHPREIIGRLTDIILIDIGIHQPNLRRILVIRQTRLDDLVHRRDPRSTRNHQQVIGQVPRVRKLALGPLDLDVLPDRQEGKVPRDITLFIRLDEQVESTRVLAIERRGRVTPHDILPVNLGTDGNVLTDGQAEDRLRVNALDVSCRSRDLKHVEIRVVGERGLVDETHAVPVCDGREHRMGLGRAERYLG